MKYSLVNVDKELDGMVSGVWLQDHIGTLESAIENAIATEQANSNRITVAVVEDLGLWIPDYNRRTDMKRLDAGRNKRCIYCGTEPINATTSKQLKVCSCYMLHRIEGKTVQNHKRQSADSVRQSKFTDIKVGDVVFAYDEYSHDYTEHVLRVTSVEFHKEYVTESNPDGMCCYGTDLSDTSDEHMSVITEGNFCWIVTE